MLCIAVYLLAQVIMELESPAFGQEPSATKGFIAIPLLFVGFVCLQAGFGGAVAKYAVEEMSPATRTMANNLGLRGEAGPYCSSCGTRSDAGDRFCSSCGGTLPAPG